MFTIITLGPYTQSKQLQTFHGECNLNVICENKMPLIGKCVCMSATDLNHAVGHLCHVVGVCSKLHKEFHDYCFFSLSDQLVASG